MRVAAMAVPWVLAALTGCGGRRHTPASDGSARPEPHAGPSVAVLDLSQGLPEQQATNVLGLPGRNATLEEFLREGDRLAKDSEVRGVLVRLGTAGMGMARANEIGSILQGIGLTKPVFCHADDLSNATLYLASLGCKRIWLSPAGSVDAVGIAAETIYFHKLLADDLGLDIDFLQVGKYKGAEEPFTRDGPSPEAQASLESTLGQIRGAWLEGIRKSRPKVPEGAAEDGPYSAPAARGVGLVDEIGYYDQARDALEKECGAVRAEVRLGGPGSGGGDFGDVLRALAGDSLGAPVAVVPATGAISMEANGGLGSSPGGIAERRLARTLTHLAKDDDVKAVVLRIDSPGGSALASDLLWHALVGLREKKPLVVSIGGMAASGGMYLASSGTVVFADEASIVGSIGVVGGKISAKKALERIGVHAETVPARPGDPHAAARAGAESILEPWDDATRARLLETMTSIYELFVARVAEGRRIPAERVRASAEGKLFAGAEGKARGLVDEIGGLREALARARSLAGLAADARFVVVEENPGLLDAFGGEGSQSRGGGAFPAVVLGSDDVGLSEMEAGWHALERLAPHVAPFVAGLWPMFGFRGEREGAVCTLPFALTVR